MFKTPRHQKHKPFINPYRLCLPWRPCLPLRPWLPCLPWLPWLFLMLGSVLPLRADDTQRLLEAADRARGSHMEGFEVTTTVEAFTSGRNNREVFFIRGKGANILAETREPLSRRGNLMLIQDGRVWFTRPGLSRPVALSRRQRLMGHADYGDLTPTDYARHYRVKTRTSGELDDHPCHILKLQATHPDALYDQMKLWICKTDEVVLRADSFSLSGKQLKSSRLWYEQILKNPDGTEQKICTRIRMTERLPPGEDFTLIHFSEHRRISQPDSLFHVNRLGR